MNMFQCLVLLCNAACFWLQAQGHVLEFSLKFLFSDWARHLQTWSWLTSGTLRASRLREPGGASCFCFCSRLSSAS
ncbi:hypothetical protein B0T21DRAFT_359355 [Apiosordaria backusii]|uniref:Secreted protein n=1 Tax=Apiosordaria backusii TaxID=314023 RepID=A0AA40ETH2_9PEZI|nr:hypothetical protein B0T21DRAFT_359355 [Apiosordaria backusii]